MSTPSARAIRPRWGRVVAGSFFVVLPVLGALLLNSMYRNGIDHPEYTVTIIGVVLAAMIFLGILFSIAAKPSTDGLYVRNLIQRYRLDWAEIVALNFSVNRPWGVLDLANGDSVTVMALQSADGRHAFAEAERLAEWIRWGEGHEPEGR